MYGEEEERRFSLSGPVGSSLLVCQCPLGLDNGWGKKADEDQPRYDGSSQKALSK